MKTLAKADKRSDTDYQKKDDQFYNAVRRIFNANPKQMIAFSNIFSELCREKIHEAETAMALAYSIALIDTEHFGTGVRSTRLLRVQRNAVKICNDAYGHDCIDANGFTVYDGCGQERLKQMLRSRGVIFMGEGEDKCTR